MPTKNFGIRALGELDPIDRSNIMRLNRQLKDVNAQLRSAHIGREASVVRQSGVQNIRDASAGGRSVTVSCGRDADKPVARFLLERGITSLLYCALDTNKLYMWNGTAYKSTTLT